MDDPTFTWRLENLKGAFEFGGRALQAVLLVNGGAAVALLALIGNLSTRATGAFHVSVPELRLSLAAFALGAFFAPIAAALGWWAQLETINTTLPTVDPGKAIRIWAAVIGLFGMLAFAVGTGLASLALG